MPRLDIGDLLAAAPDAAAGAQDMLHELLRALPGARALFDAARALAPSPADTLALPADQALMPANLDLARSLGDLSTVSGLGAPCSAGDSELGQGCAEGGAHGHGPGAGAQSGPDVEGLPSGRVSWAPRQWQLLALLRACGACQRACNARVHAAMAQARPAHRAVPEVCRWEVI